MCDYYAADIDMPLAPHEGEGGSPGSVNPDEHMDDDGWSTSGLHFSSANNSLHENGRRYHESRHARYHFPNDEMEQEREDLLHHMVSLLCGDKLHFAPLDVEGPCKIVDVGTGT